jgi:hypothetical protein
MAQLCLREFDLKGYFSVKCASHVIGTVFRAGDIPSANAFSVAARRKLSIVRTPASCPRCRSETMVSSSARLGVDNNSEAASTSANRLIEKLYASTDRTSKRCSTAKRRESTRGPCCAQVRGLRRRHGEGVQTRFRAFDPKVPIQRLPYFGSGQSVVSTDADGQRCGCRSAIAPVKHVFIDRRLREMPWRRDHSMAQIG